MTTPDYIPAILDVSTHKYCYKCKLIKPRDEFGKDKSAKDGLNSKCRSCRSAHHAEHRERDNENNRKRQKNRRLNDPEYRAKRNEKARQYHWENRDEILARKRKYYSDNTEQHRQYRKLNAARLEIARKAWYETNRERVAETHKAWYEANRERLKDLSRKNYWDNAEKRREHHRNYYNSPSGKAASYAAVHRRRARKAQSGGNCTTADLAAIRAAQTDKKGRLICWRCGKPIEGTPDLDHWIPLDKNGANNPGNLHYMHATCNRSKGAKHPTELGRLL